MRTFMMKWFVVLILALTASTSETRGCPLGAQGTTAPNCRVCARTDAGVEYCTEADAMGLFYLTGDTQGCLPAGELFFFCSDCPEAGKDIDWNPQQSIDLRCPRVCGTRGAGPCPKGEFCDFHTASNCGANDLGGVCQPLPKNCDQEYDPVCGCDGKTYSNECTAHAAGVSVKSKGPCFTPVGQCDLAVAKYLAGDLVVGQPATFNLTVMNVGSATCRSPIKVSDLLPAGLSPVGTAPATWSCDNQVNCSHTGSLAPGKSLSLEITVAVGPDAPETVRNCASVGNGRSPESQPQGQLVPGDRAPVETLGSLDINRTNSRACDCSPVKECPDLVVNLDTGFDEKNATPIPGSGLDDDWQIVGGGPAVVVQDASIVWGAPVGQSKWISVDATGGSAANSRVELERCFCLGTEFAGPQLSLTLRADNSATVELNGVAIGQGGEFNVSPLTVTGVTATNGSPLLAPGKNCLTVVVKNDSLVTALSLSGTFQAAGGSCDCRGHGAPDSYCGRSLKEWYRSGHVANFFGSPLPATYSGTNSSELILGSQFNDTLNGRGGNDCIFGFGGADNLRGGPGQDEVHGGATRDTIEGDAGNDLLFGEEGDDRIDGDSGSDAIYGGEGGDLINGDSGDDVIHGGDGDDRIDGDAGRDTIYGDGGNDTVQGDAGRDTIDGGDGDDTLHGNSGRDDLKGGAGKDRCFGGGDQDTCSCEQENSC